MQSTVLPKQFTESIIWQNKQTGLVLFCASNLSPLSTSEEQKKGNWLVTRLLLLPHIFLALFSFVFASYLNSLSTNEEQKNINSWYVCLFCNIYRPCTFFLPIWGRSLPLKSRKRLVHDSFAYFATFTGLVHFLLRIWARSLATKSRKKPSSWYVCLFCHIYRPCKFFVSNLSSLSSSEEQNKVTGSWLVCHPSDIFRPRTLFCFEFDLALYQWRAETGWLLIRLVM